MLLRTDKVLSENDARFLAEEVWPLCGTRTLSAAEMMSMETRTGFCKRCHSDLGGNLHQAYCPVCRAIMRAETHRRYDEGRAA